MFLNLLYNIIFANINIQSYAIESIHVYTFIYFKTMFDVCGSVTNPSYWPIK